MNLICSKKECGQNIEYSENAKTVICPKCKTVYRMMSDSSDLLRVKNQLVRKYPKVKMSKRQRLKERFNKKADNMIFGEEGGKI
jgi:hypothetical protein